MKRRVGCHHHTQLKEGAHWHFQPQNDVLMSLFLAPREAAVWWAKGLSQNHIIQSRLAKNLDPVFTDSYFTSILILSSYLRHRLLWHLQGKLYLHPARLGRFHSLSRHSLIKNLRGWDLKAQPSSFIRPNVIHLSSSIFALKGPDICSSLQARDLW